MKKKVHDYWGAYVDQFVHSGTVDMGDTSDESSSSGPTTPKKKIRKNPSLKVYQQKWRDCWKSEPTFAGWLEKSTRSTSSKHLAYCAICNSDISCSKSDIMGHACNQRHKNLSLQHASNKSLASFLISNDPVDKSARKIELKICSFLAEHYLPISLCEPFLLLLKNLFHENDALKRVHLGKQRASNVIRQVFGKHLLQELCEVLKERMFSVIIDETTDRNTTKQMSIIVQYWDDSKNKIQNSFLDLVEVHDSTAEGLANTLKQSLQEKHIPIENVVAFCSDTTNVMMGGKHSVATLLRDILPNVIIVKCSCHLIHLCASHACLKLPKFLEDLCRSIFAHFSLSSKRQDTYKQFQEFVGVAPHQILAPGQTRWLSLELCVNRLIEQWEALKLYFTDVAFSDPTNSNDAILQYLNDKFSLVYLEFLSHNLARFNSFNTKFQSESPKFYCLKQEVCKLIRSICSDFMSIPFVKRCEIPMLNPNHPLFSANFVPANNIYLGVSAMATLKDLKPSSSPNDVKTFYANCLNFLIESVRQIQTRFSLEEPIHSIVQCLDPKNAVNLQPKSLAPVFDAIPQLCKYADKKKTDEEWRSHCFCEELTAQTPCLEYWDTILNKRNSANLPCYPNLKVVVSVLLSLPFSNASVERFFSKLNLTKTPQRSRLKNETLCGLMHMVYYLSNKNATSDTFTIEEKMISALKAIKSNATCSEV